MDSSFRVPGCDLASVKVLCLLLACWLTATSAANTTAYCTRNSNINATGRAKITPLPEIKLSIVLERNEGTVDFYQGKGNVSVISGDGEVAWGRIANFSQSNKDAMIVVIRNNFGQVNVHRDEQLGDDDYYYDTSKDREKNGEVMEVAHFGGNMGLMEISAGTSQALLVILTNNVPAALTSDSDTLPDTKSKQYLTFAATATNETGSNRTKPMKLETCNLYGLMGVPATECYGCPVVSRGGGSLKVSAQQCVNKVSEICSCKLFLQGRRTCIKRVIKEQCKHTVPSDSRFRQETLKQYGEYCQKGT